MDHETSAQEWSEGCGSAADGARAGAVVPMPVRVGRHRDRGHPGGGHVEGADAVRTHAGPGPSAGSGAFTVDCADCAHRETAVCGDCVVSFVVGREPDDALVVDADEARAVRLLAQAGLVPGVRHEAQASGL